MMAGRGPFPEDEVSSTSLRRVPMSTDAISPLRQRMIEDMSARKLNPHTQRSHISSCKRFAAYLKRSPIVPGGGISLDGQRWVSCRPNFFLAVRVLSRLFRRLVLQMLIVAHETGRLQFSGAHAALADTNAFAAFLVPLRRSEWVVYSKEPFGGPEAVLAYLARYTHRVAISNHRLIAADAVGVTFK